MTNQKLLQIILDTEEWQHFDCKRAAVQPRKLLETAVAFANTDGGWIVIGLEDPRKASGDQRLIGISENPDNVSEFLKLVEKEIEPPLRLWNKNELDIRNVQNVTDKLLIISIKKSADIHSLKNGDTFVRRGNQTVKIGAQEIKRLQYEKGSVRFEDETSEILTLDDIETELLQKYKKDTESESQDDWQFLRDNGLATKSNGDFHLTKAGALLFGKNPAVMLKSKCGIKISHYYGTKPTYSGEPNFVHRPFTIEGPLLYQIQKTIKYFRETVRESPPKLRGGTFRPSLLIPEWAFQEAATNAVIHRNYFVEDDIQIRFFDDRIEIESPGTYPGHITPFNIRSERFSRNPIIQRVLNRFQEAPNLDIGEGVDRLFKIMREKNLYEPIYLPPSIRPNSVLLILLNIRKVEYWDTVSKYLDDHYRITNREAREITSINDTLKMSRLLRAWASKGLLEKRGSKGFRGDTYYSKPGVERPSIFKG